MKIIFLDIDGVLIAFKWFKERKKFQNFNPECVNALKHIVEQTGAKIVISSTWRIYPYDWKYLFKAHGLDPNLMVGHTPILSDIRGEEILAWLRDLDWGEVESFVILDDYDEMGDLKDHLVLTDGKIGLTMQDAQRAIEILNS